MDTKKYIYLSVIVVVLALIMPGCSWLKSYGKLRVQSGPGHKVTIEELKENWDDYTIYYAGLSVDHPSAVMFDPKNDSTSLVSDKWVKVEDQETLSGLIGSIQRTTHFYPIVQRILGPDDQFYGYFFSAWHNVLIKAVDDRTLWVYDLPLSPDLYYNAGGDAAEGRGTTP
jgi:hypothetical protein